MTLDDVWPVLEPALRHADEGYTKDDIAEGLRSGRLLLFTYGKSAAIVARFPDYLRIGLGGGCLEECQQIERQITAFARNEGYARVQIVGRDWRRALPGYRKKAVILEKSL